MTPDVAVIIVNFNTRAELESCLGSLAGAPPACVARIIIVDNASTDGSIELVRSRWPRVEVLAQERNLGFGAANNVALRKCPEPYALLLNSDTTVPAGAIDRLRDRLLAMTAAAAGPRIVDRDGKPELSHGRMLTPWTEFVQRRRQRNPGPHTAEEQLVDWVTGACMLLDVAAVRAAGYFDERFFMYEEDVDLCASLRAAGGRILFTPAAEIVHVRGRSPRAPVAAGTGAHYDRSHLAFYEKHAAGWAPVLRLWMRLRGRRVR
ncbi:MAG TPA: glycosyltransferase family 2 protein [Vicinamibacterales bacterium]|nr:glycosyltransferase family 2 protein [Vicinamibacterales bacterium]